MVHKEILSHEINMDVDAFLYKCLTNKYKKTENIDIMNKTLKI